MPKQELKLAEIYFEKNGVTLIQHNNDFFILLPEHFFEDKTCRREIRTIIGMAKIVSLAVEVRGVAIRLPREGEIAAFNSAFNVAENFGLPCQVGREVPASVLI